MYRHTDVKYFPLGEEMLEAMIEDLKKAEKCIFLEYFIISDWRDLEESQRSADRESKSGYRYPFINR